MTEKTILNHPGSPNNFVPGTMYNPASNNFLNKTEIKINQSYKISSV